MITKLTPEQEALMEVYKDKWIGIGLDTKPIDQKQATEDVYKMYDCANLSRPDKVYFASSPVHAIEIFKRVYNTHTQDGQKTKKTYWSIEVSHLLCSLSQREPIG